SASIAQPLNLGALAAGLAGGAALGVWGLKLTKFERTPEGLFYTPDMRIGIALSALFVGRVLYRIGQIYFVDVPAARAAAPMDFVRSPLTLVILGTLLGYYVCYAVGLIRWRRQSQAPSGRPAVDEEGTT